MIKSIAAAAMLLASQGAAAPEQCLPRARAGQLAVALLPSLIDAADRLCDRHLPDGAFLGTGSRALSMRLRTETAADRAAAAEAMLTMTGQDPSGQEGDPDTMADVMSAGIALSLDATQCRSASEFLEAIAPLPARNIALAFSAALGVALAQAGEDAPPICRE